MVVVEVVVGVNFREAINNKDMCEGEEKESVRKGEPLGQPGQTTGCCSWLSNESKSERKTTIIANGEPLQKYQMKSRRRGQSIKEVQ